MQVSTKFTIALHVLLAVKYFEKDYKLTSDFLSASIGSNPVIIRNIMSQLREAGIIDIKRGPGGMRITRDLKDISFLTFIRQWKPMVRESFLTSMRSQILTVRWESAFILYWIKVFWLFRKSLKRLYKTILLRSCMSAWTKYIG